MKIQMMRTKNEPPKHADVVPDQVGEKTPRWYGKRDLSSSGGSGDYQYWVFGDLLFSQLQYDE
jgi:hypothetical protein